MQLARYFEANSHFLPQISKNGIFIPIAPAFGIGNHISQFYF
jgi:hypothetical protein